MLVPELCFYQSASSPPTSLLLSVSCACKHVARVYMCLCLLAVRRSLRACVRVYTPPLLLQSALSLPLAPFIADTAEP